VSVAVMVAGVLVLVGRLVHHRSSGGVRLQPNTPRREVLQSPLEPKPRTPAVVSVSRPRGRGCAALSA